MGMFASRLKDCEFDRGVEMWLDDDDDDDDDSDDEGHVLDLGRLNQWVVVRWIHAPKMRMRTPGGKRRQRKAMVVHMTTGSSVRKVVAKWVI
jgi:hypothetical protein